MVKQAVIDRSTELLKRAVIDCDLDKVKKLIEEVDVDVNTMIFHDKTALHTACQNGSTQVAKCLLENGASVNKINCYRQTALYTACQYGHAATAHYLLEHGASVNRGEKPLIVAVRNNRCDCVQLLLEYQADVNCTNSEGESPLHIALQSPHYSQRPHAHKCNVKIILLLLQYNATLLPSLKHISCELLMNAEAQHAEAIQKLIAENCISLKSEGTYLAAFDYAFTHGPKELAEKVMSNDNYSKIEELHTKAAYYSAKNNWPDILSKLLEEIVNINELTCGQTPLYAACEKGHEFIVSLLLSNGADPNIQNDEMPFLSWPTLPLHIAVQYASPTIVEVLLKKGASVNPPGEPLLHIACADDDQCETVHQGTETTFLQRMIAVIRLLLQQGLDVNTISSKGDTALYRACKSKHLEVVQILLEAGADINLTSTKLYPLMVACKVGSAEIINLLLKAGAGVKCLTHNNETCLHAIASISPYLYAANWKTAGEEGETRSMERISLVLRPTVRLLLQHGVDVNAISGNGDTALYRACRSQQLEVVETLLEAGADVNLTSNKLYPLMAACMVGSTELVNVLLKAGADTICCNSNNESCLHAVINACASTIYCENSDTRQEVVKRYVSLAEVLLSAGADINQVDRRGASPLYLACVKGETELVKLLLSRGANPDTRSDTYPVLAACSGRHYDIVKLLLDYGADVAVLDKTDRTVLHHVLECDESREKQAELIELLLDRGANVNEASSGGGTPFYIACSKGLESVVKKMLECGAKVNGKSDRKLALNIACKNEHTPVVQLLLTNGADPNLKVACDDSDDSDYYDYIDDCDEETPFYIACSKGLESVAKEMLEYGAEVNGNSDEFLPLNAACRNGHISLVQLLLSNGASPNLKEISYDDDDDQMFGAYPLCVAAAGDKSAIVELLLKHGANVDIGQCTPLHDALKRLIDEIGNYPCRQTYIETKLSTIRLLLQHGANVNTLMRNGKTPLNVAVNTLADSEKHIDELLQLMVKYGAVLQDHDDGADEDSSAPEDPKILKALATFDGRCKFIVDMFRAGAGFQLLARCCNAVATISRSTKSIYQCQAAVLAGYKPTTEELDNLQSEADRQSNTVSGDLMQQLVNWLNDDREQAPSLRRQCRVVIRRQLSVAARFKTILPAIEQMAEQLELPRIVKEYLQFDGPLTEVDFSITDQLIPSFFS